MFQKSSYNADHTNIFRCIFYARDQTADTADDQINLYSGTGSFDQPVYDLFVSKCVHFQPDISIFSGKCSCNLIIDHRQHFILQTERCYQQFVCVFYDFSHRQCLKNSSRLFCDLCIGCHQGKVCVKARCFFVIISCSDLRDILHFIAGFSGDLAQFGMYFKSIQPIDHMTSGTLQPS